MFVTNEMCERNEESHFRDKRNVDFQGFSQPPYQPQADLRDAQIDGIDGWTAWMDGADGRMDGWMALMG